MVTNSVGMELVLVPAGEFLMGSPDSDDDAYYEERPQHRVRITRPFYLGVHPVTQAQYQRVMRNNPSHFKGNPNRPVEQVSWDDAEEFCRKLSALRKERAAGRLYRLPTEAEWEYACRAGATTRWHFGDTERRLGEYAWFSKNSGNQTHPVGRRKPNAWGLFDMHRNVWEWCANWYARYRKAAAVDPKGPPDGSSRVIRGGSLEYVAWLCRSAFRSRRGPGCRGHDVGFRVSQVPADE